MQGKAILLVETELLNWDAEHYHAISKKGYFGINVAFFPLLPAIWRLSGFNAYGITLFNILIFYAGFVWLAGLLSLKKREVLLALSIPGFMFFYVPYTEALFFLLSVLVLYSFKRENLLYLLTGLFFLTLTRTIISVLLPAIILTILLKKQAANRFYSIRTILLCLLVIAMAMAIIVFIQNNQTGEPFGFFTYHRDYWHHYFRIPSFPLGSWENSTRLVLLLDGIGLFISFLCTFRLSVLIWNKFKGQEYDYEGFEILALFYLIGGGFAILLFQGGNIMSMNRYLFATAFFIVIFKHFADWYKFKPAHFFYLFASLEVFWLLFKSYDRLNTFLRLSLASVYYTGILAVFHRSVYVKNTAFVIFYVLNAITQMYCLDVFMSGQWVS
ncbi:hypothetical protein ACFPIB_00600 [Adhaeribacter terreus]|uniref:DUF2029 domain-containing protein n=1 Tax=Adhaeribacter terreus TaxID=529703 RepID=A0ABW0E7Q7_9BACT